MTRAELRQKLRRLSIEERLDLIELTIQTIQEELKKQATTRDEDLPAPANDELDYSLLSEESLAHVWENDDDAVYDNWKELYNAQEG